MYRKQPIVQKSNSYVLLCPVLLLDLPTTGVLPLERWKCGSWYGEERDGCRKERVLSNISHIRSRLTKINEHDLLRLNNFHE